MHAHAVAKTLRIINFCELANPRARAPDVVHGVGIECKSTLILFITPASPRSLPLSLVAMAARLGRSLCSYTRLYASRALAASPRLVQLSQNGHTLSPSLALRGAAAGCFLLLQASSRLHTSRWLSSDGVDFNEPSKCINWVRIKIISHVSLL